MLRRSSEVTWSNPRVLTTLAIIFLCGAAVGAVIMRSMEHLHIEAAQPAPAIEQAQHYGLGALKTKLDLTPIQVQEITKILDDYAKFYQNIEDEREDTAAVGKQRIFETLTPEQRQRFIKMLAPRTP